MKNQILRFHREIRRRMEWPEVVGVPPERRKTFYHQQKTLSDTRNNSGGCLEASSRASNSIANRRIAVFRATGDQNADVENPPKKNSPIFQLTNENEFLKLKQSNDGAFRTAGMKSLDVRGGVPLQLLPELCRTSFWHSHVTFQCHDS